MTDETIDQAVEGEALPDTEVEANEAETPDTDAPEWEEGDPEPDSAEDPDEDEIEDGEKKARVPKWVKEGFLRQSDYTKKTQEVAETRKALEAQAQAVAQQAEFIESNRVEIAKLGKIDHDYAEWKSWIDANPDQALPADYHKLTTLKEERDQLAASLRQKAHTASVEAQRADAKALEDMRAELPKAIPGYGPEKEREIFTFATTDLGFAPEEIAGVRSPKIVKALHLAMLGAKASKAQATAAKQTQAQKTKPPSTLRGTAGRFTAPPDTSDFAAFERLADAKLAPRK